MSRIMKRFLTVLACILPASQCQSVIGQESMIVEVAAGDVERSNIPIWLALPDAVGEATSLVLQRLDTGQRVDIQRSQSDPQQAAWILDGRLARGQARRYRLFATSIPQRSSNTVSCRDTNRALKLSVSGHPVLTYHTAVVVPPAGLDPVFSRSGFIHPLITPSGQVVTADFPADHAHQHGIFFAWKQTEFEGRPVDFWNQADRTGHVEHVQVNHDQSGPVFAEISVSLRHLDLTAPDGPKPALDEEWIVRLYRHRDVHVFDLLSKQQCASESPLTMLEYHYGGMGYRGPVEWLGTDSGFEMRTSEGIGRKEGNHTRPKWVDCTGPIDGQLCGLRVIQHPENFRYPQPVRLHPSKPYFVFAPEVLGEFSIEPEQVYVSRYRYVAFDGQPAKSVEALAVDFVDPPTVRIIE